MTKTKTSVYDMPRNDELVGKLSLAHNRNLYSLRYLHELRDACHKTDKFLNRYSVDPLTDSTAQKSYEYRIGITLADLNNYENKKIDDQHN